MTRKKNKIISWLFVVVVCSLLSSKCIKAEDDLYKILGVARTATVKEIKQAYRRKALDTHPDKNKGIPAEEAAQAFHKVVHAFETLSDEESRRRYDRTGRHSDQNQANSGGGGFGSWSWSFTWNSGGGGGGSSSGGGRNSGGRNNQYYYYQQRYRPRLKDRFDVKEAQSRVLHIASLEQLETVILDDDNNETLERNLLIVFYTPKLEENLMDEMVYPWPFAGYSTQGIWWEDLLQTTAVRFHRSNKLTEYFQIPNGDTLEKPVFIFGKRGLRFDAPKENWSRLETDRREVFDKWMWDQISVEVQFVNHHDHPVEIYWIHDMRGGNSFTLDPGASSFHMTRLSHEWWVRDARVDTRPDSPGRWKLADNSMLIKFHITSDEHLQKLIIPLRKCYDLSGHCGFWKMQGECTKNPVFMGQDCRKTCELCSPDEDASSSDQDADHDEL